MCITALETGLTGTFRLTTRKDLKFDWPFAENEKHLMSIGLDEDLDTALALLQRGEEGWLFAHFGESSQSFVKRGSLRRGSHRSERQALYRWGDLAHREHFTDAGDAA